MRFLARNGHKVWWDEKAATKMEVDDVRTSMA
jgi:hypothetical protein